MPDQPSVTQPFAPGQTYQTSQTTGLPNVERYEVLVDESRTNTVAFTNSTYLVCPVQPGETIFWMAMLIFGGNSPGNAKVQFVVPAGIISGGIMGVVHGVGVPPSLANAGLAGYGAPFLLAEDNTGVGDEFPNFIWGRFVNGVAGEFSVQWAQNGVNATPSLLLATSYLEVYRR